MSPPERRTENADPPMAGSILIPVGRPAWIRIPVPGTNGLAIEFWPRGHVPASGSTSTVFIQDPTGKRHLRLDYGWNKNKGTIDYHWNQKGTFNEFGIPGHTSVGPLGARAYQAARAFRYAGRVLVVVGIAMDVYSITQADKPLRRTSEVVFGWAGAWAGGEALGAAGAAGGSLIEPGGGTIIGGLGGSVLGGIGGYFGGRAVGGYVYDWAENTHFTRLPEVPLPW